MDDQIRNLERRAFLGDCRSREFLERERCRAGKHCACTKKIKDLLSYHFVRVTTDSLGIPLSGDIILRLRGRPTTVSTSELLEKMAEVCELLGITGPASSPIEVKCSYCGASPGNHCITNSGKRANDFHAARTHAGCDIEWKDAFQFTIEGLE